MSNKIIRGVKDLPDWYDLKSYERSSSLKAVEWYELLLIRFTFHYMLKEEGQEYFANNYTDNGIDPIYEALNQTRNYSITFILLTHRMIVGSLFVIY